MERVRITTAKRAKIFERRDGLCHLCGLKVVAGQDWDVSHANPLGAGGADDESNWFVAHRKCHRIQTSEFDVPLVAKVTRKRNFHSGAKVTRNPLPGGRRSPFKKRMDGTVVRRDEE